MRGLSFADGMMKQCEVKFLATNSCCRATYCTEASAGCGVHNWQVHDIGQGEQCFVQRGQGVCVLVLDVFFVVLCRGKCNVNCIATKLQSSWCLSYRMVLARIQIHMSFELCVFGNFLHASPAISLVAQW